jgi:two-component system alkaline phosphatase synthesis response regulator PhoP
MRAKILVVEDEASMRAFLGDRLLSEGYAVDFAADGKEGLEKASSSAFDAIILDLMLPAIGGLEVCRRIRLAGMATPILILTARGQIEDKVSGFKLGADDYVTKPFEVREILARIEALLRRTARADTHTGIYEFGPVRVDLVGTEITLNGSVVNLSTREFELLRYLVLNRGKTVTREELLREVWGYSAEAYTRTVDVHIASLRTKLGVDAERSNLIQTIKGIGYKISA